MTNVMLAFLFTGRNIITVHSPHEFTINYLLFYVYQALDFTAVIKRTLAEGNFLLIRLLKLNQLAQLIKISDKNSRL
jgi:hypothetical protein